MRAIDLAVKTPVKVIQEVHLWYVAWNLIKEVSKELKKTVSKIISYEHFVSLMRT